MKSASWWFVFLFEYAIFYYGIFLMLSYLLLVALSIIEIKKYNIRKRFINFSPLLSSRHVPGISIIAPAFNEGRTIINGVHTLLSLNYQKFEVIVVNDGSSDDSLPQLIKEYDLVKAEHLYKEVLKTHPVKGIYKSSNPVFAKLIIVDKENGNSKADACNAAINVSSYPLFLGTDIDCILNKDTLLKMVRPFIESKTRVIAAGAVIRVSNSCEVENGYMKKAHVSKQYFPLFQELEYIRAFLLGRMAWSKINGLMLVSGGIGLFDKEIVLAAGGYDNTSLGEDMELIARMRMWMHDNGQKYLVKYIPESLCWTEVPTSIKVLGRQRTRWAKGLVQTLWIHRKAILNPKYKVFGLLTYPYWILFEWLAPLIEAGGILFYIYLIITGQITWEYAIVLFIFVYSFSVLITLISVLWGHFAGIKYSSTKEILRLFMAAAAEPVAYHPLVLFFFLRGNWSFITNRKLVWGEMTRVGFKRKKTVVETSAIP